jgi:hypothetical protein
MVNIKWTQMDTLIKLEKAQNSLSSHKSKQKENMVTYFSGSVENSYYEVSQHEKFHFNIQNFKQRFNDEGMRPKIGLNGHRQNHLHTFRLTTHNFHT